MTYNQGGQSQYLHPDLEALAAQYDRIVAQWNSGELNPEDGAAALASLELVDGRGMRWRISPETGNWEWSAGGPFEEADPSAYTEPTAAQVDDWSVTDRGAGDWDGTGGGGEIPPGWGEGDSSGWQPGGARGAAGRGDGRGGGREERSPTYGPGFDAYDSPDAPPPHGVTADWYRGDEEGRAFGGEWAGEEWEEHGGGMRDLAGRVRLLLASLWERRAVKILAVGLAILIVGAMVSQMVGGGGGRSCGTLENIVLGDVSEENSRIANCAVAELLMPALAHDEVTGIATFGPTQAVDRRDLARSIGMTYLALGGAVEVAPVPPDYDQLDPLGRTTPAIVTAYALRLVDAPVASGGAVSSGEAILAVAKLAEAAGVEGGGETGAMAYLIAAGIVEAEYASSATETVSRIQLAEWLVRLFESGGEVERAAGEVPGVGEGSSTTVPGEATTTTIQPTTTTTTAPAAGLTSEIVSSVMADVTSGDRGTAAAAIANPGEANVIALRTAELWGMNSETLSVVPGAPAQNDEGRWLVTLTLFEVGSGEGIAAATVEVVEGGTGWQIRDWPRFEPLGAGS